MTTVLEQKPKQQEIALDPEQDFIQAFATPIVNTNIGGADRLNLALKELILAKRDKEEGLKKSNVGGWHSTTDLFLWEEPPIITLRTLVHRLVIQAATQMCGEPPKDGKLSFEAWANVNGQGDFNRVHNHPGSHLSGVYYVDVGAPYDPNGEAGQLEFQDPRGFLNMHPMPGKGIGKSLLVKPKEGKIVIFPSFIFHTALPHKGERERISIAFNAGFSR